MGSEMKRVHRLHKWRDTKTLGGLGPTECRQHVGTIKSWKRAPIQLPVFFPFGNLFLEFEFCALYQPENLSFAIGL